MFPFRSTLQALLDLEGLDQVSLAKRSGFSQSKISRFLSGALVPSRQDLAQLVAVISSLRDRRIELLLAFLREEAAACHSRAGFDARHYVIKPVDNGLGGSLGSDLEFLAEQAAVHSDVRDMLQDMAAMLHRSQWEIDQLRIYQVAALADIAVPARGIGQIADQKKR